MIVAYTNPKNATSAIAEFSKSEWYKESAQTLSMKLSQYFTKENKIFVQGLRETTESAV